MQQITATEAARRFSEILDAVEHRGHAFPVSRQGRTIARIEPAGRSTGRVARDERWSRELGELRAALILEERRWGD